MSNGVQLDPYTHHPTDQSTAWGYVSTATGHPVPARADYLVETCAVPWEVYWFANGDTLEPDDTAEPKHISLVDTSGVRGQGKIGLCMDPGGYWLQYLWYCVNVGTAGASHQAAIRTAIWGHTTFADMATGGTNFFDSPPELLYGSGGGTVTGAPSTTGWPVDSYAFGNIDYCFMVNSVWAHPSYWTLRARASDVTGTGSLVLHKSTSAFLRRIADSAVRD